MTHDATLAGVLEVRLVNDYVPDVGTTFDFLTVGGNLSGMFADAEGLFSFPGGDRYFDIVLAGNGLQLEVKQAPGGLQYDPPSKDDFGEFLSDYFPATTFSFTGGLSVPGFVELSGSFSLEKAADGSKLVIGAAGVNAFSGTGRGTPETTDDVGLEVSNANLGAVVFTPPGGPSSYALTASGTVALVGLDGLLIEGTVAVQVNNTGGTVNETVGGVLVKFDTPDEVQAVQGSVALEVGGVFLLGGESDRDQDPQRGGVGRYPGDAPRDRVARRGGLRHRRRLAVQHRRQRRFPPAGHGFDQRHRVWRDVGGHASGVLPSFGSSGSGGPGGTSDDFAVELTSLPGLSVDANLLNRRQYIDVTYFAPLGTNVDPLSIDTLDFRLERGGVPVAEVDNVVCLGGNTFRYYLTEDSLFTAGNVDVIFDAASWANDEGVPSPAQTFAVTVRDGAATVTDPTPMSVGPLAIRGPHIGIEDFQYKMVLGGADLTITVGIGASEASLDFGGGQSSSGVTVQLTGLLGTFQLAPNVGGSGLANLTGAFGFQVDQLTAEVPDVVALQASGICVSYDPNKDADGDGTVTPAEQEADDNREIIHVESASIEISKVGVTGSIVPHDSIPGLSVRNNGFGLGTAMLTKEGLIDLGGILELNGVTVGVTDFGVTFGQAVDFDGEVFIASGGANLFPGKTVSVSITDGPDAGTEAVRCALTFTDGRVDGLKFSADSTADHAGRRADAEGLEHPGRHGAPGRLRKSCPSRRWAPN